MSMTIGVLKEIHPGERRVAATPETVKHLLKLGYSVLIETGAGAAAKFTDAAYHEVGAEIVADVREVWARAAVVIKVNAPQQHPELNQDEAELLREGGCLISFIRPAQNPELLERLKARQATVLAVDAVPRISRAQKLDALSSMANIGGYRAVIEAAHHFGRFFTGQITAAGKVPPAKVMVIGGGVAGLAAIGTATSLGAIVRAFDTRPEVRQQIESLGGEFLELDFEEEGAGEGGYAKEMSPAFIDAEMALFREQAREVDMIITTALIPGKPAPKLILADMVESMREGSVIVDMASEQGGNCELTEPGEVVVRHGVTIIGYTDLPSRLPTQSSQLYATNVRHLLAELTPEKDGQTVVNMDDEVIRGCTVIKEGEITWPPPPPKLSAAPAKPKAAEQPPVAVDPAQQAKQRARRSITTLIIGGLALLGIGTVAPPSFTANLTVFVLACFVGWQVVWNVTPALHTPLMSVTNAISSVIVIGALLQVSNESAIVVVLALVAIFITTINIFGGFYVTQRMLQMFRKD